MVRAMDNTFGEWLGMELKRREMSQAELSRKLETSQSTVNNWVLGNRIPQPESCDRLSDVLNIPLDVVLAKAGHRVELGGEVPADIAEVGTIMGLLPDDHRDEVLEFARWRLRRARA